MKKDRVKAFTDWARHHRLASTIIVLALIVIGLGTVFTSVVSIISVPGKIKSAIWGERGKSPSSSKDMQVLSESDTLEVAIVYDGTASMEPFSKHVADAVRSVAAYARENPAVHVRVSVVVFTDRSSSTPEVHAVTITADLSSDLKAIERIIRTLKTDGKASQDYAEAVFDGLDVALQYLSWDDRSNKLIVLVGDAPSHPPGDSKNPKGLTVEGIVQAAAARRVRISAFSIHTGHKVVDDRRTHQFLALTKGVNPTLSGSFHEFGETDSWDHIANDIAADVIRLAEKIRDRSE